MRQISRFLAIEGSPCASAVATAAVLFFGALASMVTLHDIAEEQAENALAKELSQLAAIAATRVDVPAHANLTSSRQVNDPDYVRVVAPLREMLRAAPDIRYLYTTRQIGGDIVFGVDAAAPLDTDGDGLIDQTRLGARYDAAPEALRRAFATGLPQVSAEPYTDDWGTFVSGFQPIYGDDGRLECVLGVDFDLRSHAEQIHAVDRAAGWGAAVGALVSTLLGLAVYVAQRARARVRQELELSRVQAVAASRAKSEFLANMSHEIRTPMTSVLGCAELIRADACNSDCGGRHAEALDVIVDSGRHLLDVINDILDLSRIEAGRMEVDARPAAPAQIVRDAVESLRIRADDRGLALETLIATDAPEFVLSDPLRLRQILCNLIGNALKFTERGSVTVQLAKSADGTQLEFSVTDTGIGMTAEQLGRVFAPFEQADSSMSRRYGGSGLGLSISQKFAELLGGSLEARSKPGVGSTFTLKLPVTPCDPPPALPAVASDRVDAPNSLEGLRVLLAEDSAVNRRLIARMLVKSGAHVTEAADGRAAVAALSSGGEFGASLAEPAPFDVVLMDMQMPVLDGYSATRLLRELGSRAAIVALTAHAMSGDRERCLAAGCDDYATKPISQRELVAVCLRVCANGGRSRATAAV